MFFQIFKKHWIKSKDFKIDPQPEFFDSTKDLGLLYMEYPYMKIFEDFKTTRARAPRILSTALEVLRGRDPHEAQGTTRRLGSTRRPAATVDAC